jgi:hypothetical protein
MKTRKPQRFDLSRDLVVVKPFKFNGKPMNAGFQFHFKDAQFSLTPAKARAMFEAGLLRHPDELTVAALPSPYIVKIPSTGEEFNLFDMPFKKLSALIQELGFKRSNNRESLQKQVCEHYSLPYPPAKQELEEDAEEDSESLEDAAKAVEKDAVAV